MNCEIREKEGMMYHQIVNTGDRPHLLTRLNQSKHAGMLHQRHMGGIRRWKRSDMPDPHVRDGTAPSGVPTPSQVRLLAAPGGKSHWCKPHLVSHLRFSK